MPESAQAHNLSRRLAIKPMVFAQLLSDLDLIQNGLRDESGQLQLQERQRTTSRRALQNIFSLPKLSRRLPLFASFMPPPQPALLCTTPKNAIHSEHSVSTISSGCARTKTVSPLVSHSLQALEHVVICCMPADTMSKDSV